MAIPCLPKILLVLWKALKASLNPALISVNGAVQSLDSLLKVVGTYFDPAQKIIFTPLLAILRPAPLNCRNC